MNRDPLYPFVERRPGVLRRFLEALYREIEIMVSHGTRKSRSHPKGYRLARRSADAKAGMLELAGPHPNPADIGSKAA